MNRRFLILLTIIFLGIVAIAIYAIFLQQPFVQTPFPTIANCDVLPDIGTTLDLQQKAALENVYEQLDYSNNVFSALTPTPIVLPGGCGGIPTG